MKVRQNFNVLWKVSIDVKRLEPERKISETTSVNAANKITKYKPQLFQLNRLDTSLQEIGIYKNTVPFL